MFKHQTLIHLPPIIFKGVLLQFCQVENHPEGIGNIFTGSYTIVNLNPLISMV